jgi:hypothetical protein
VEKHKSKREVIIMKNPRRINFIIWSLIIGIALTAGLVWAQRVKVHKHHIIVSPPNAEGIVYVKGKAGAIETTSEAKLTIENLETKKKIPVEIYEDGSFEGYIEAEAGQKIRVRARNEEKKRSYGTFTVPVPIGPTSTNKDKTKKVKSARKRASQKGNLAVVVMVIDTASGKVLATDSIKGTVKSEKGSGRKKAINRIIKQCLTAAKSELHIRSGKAGPADKKADKKKPKEKVKGKKDLSKPD